jgi:hypothetical protein
MSKKEFIVAKYENDELIEKIIELKDQLKKCNITKQSSKRHYLRNNLNKVVRSIYFLFFI